MNSEAAIRAALDLMHMPSRVRFARSAPLPKDVLLVLRIAAGDTDAERQAATLCDRSAAEIRQAAAFYIEQNLLFADADCYRTLGCTPSSPPAELRRNMALLLRWLHPDRNRDGEQSMLARRVSIAWNALKTSERRATYDRNRKPAPNGKHASGALRTARMGRRVRVNLRAGQKPTSWHRMRMWLAGWLPRAPKDYGR